MIRRIGLALAGLLILAPAAQAAQTCTKEAPCVLRVRTVAPSASPWGELLRKLSAEIEAESGKRIEFKVYWQSKSEPSAVRQCLSGKVGGIAVSNGALASAVPELEATEMPFLFESYGEADKALTAATDLIRDIMKKKGFIYALRGENGFRNFASVDGFIKTPGDLAGKTMRSQPATHHLDMYKALGATPSPIEVADVPTALSSGMVSGYDNTLLFGDLANWTEKVKYVTISKHIYQGALVAWCKGWYDELPADLQAVLVKPRPVIEQLGLKLVRIFNDKKMPEKYKAAGIQMVELSGGERAAFKSKTAEVWTKFRGRTSADGKKLLDLLEKSK
ncbi:MAG: TRAP transporter substrate-binding protein [Deltaproteobacteria bacterium]|nr:TRAP transporter substrate-binding protein [Deltaproteobacteria bacterium]